jgi:hypothetical protein
MPNDPGATTTDPVNTSRLAGTGTGSCEAPDPRSTSASGVTDAVSPVSDTTHPAAVVSAPVTGFVTGASATAAGAAAPTGRLPPSAAVTVGAGDESVTVSVAAARVTVTPVIAATGQASVLGPAMVSVSPTRVTPSAPTGITICVPGIEASRAVNSAGRFASAARRVTVAPRVSR